MRMHLQHQFFLCVVVAFAAIDCSALAHAESPPNIVFILADDMGVGDVSCLNPKSKIDTPAIDPLAIEGKWHFGITWSKKDGTVLTTPVTPNEQFVGKSQAGVYLGETTNLYATHSEVAERLLNQLEADVQRGRSTEGAFLKK